MEEEREMVRGGDREMVGAARVLEISCKVVLLVKFSDAKVEPMS